MTDPEPNPVNDRRLSLDAILRGLVANVYFQPPENLTMSYPCIVYERDNASTKYADNNPYTYTQRYQVTYIDQKPTSPVIGKLASLPLSAFSRHFATSGLNHDVFVIYH